MKIPSNLSYYKLGNISSAKISLGSMVVLISDVVKEMATNVDIQKPKQWVKC